MAEIYERLKEMRENAGLSQQQAAEFLGVTQTYISRIETGERVLKTEQLESLAGLYGFGLDAFSSPEAEAHPIRFAFRARDIGRTELAAVAEIGKIARNSRFMESVLRKADD
jgi:transcriptional regulator with XRE-family HTH domain